MKSNDSRLTLLLAQFGRHEFSNRFLKYLESTSCPFPIIYADGDADGYSKEVCQKFKNELNITLIEYKQNIKFKDYFTMVVKGLEEVQTPYVMLCDNDDFIIYSAVYKLLSFLEKHPEYISAGSPKSEIQLDDFSTKCYGNFATIYRSYAHFRDHEPLDTFEEQIEKTFLEFQPNFYNIFKKDVLLTIWKEILELDFSDLTIMEFYYQLRSTTLGKQYADPSICHYIRQTGTGSWESKTYDFSKELVYNNLPKDIRKVAKKISMICNEDFDSDSQKIYTTILDSYAKHLNNYLPHNVMRYRFSKLYNIKVFLMKIFKRLTLVRNARFFLIEKKVLAIYAKTKRDAFKEFKLEVGRIKSILLQKQ